MITLLLHLLRLLPFLCGGHRQLALENLALHQQLAVYKRTMTRPRLRTADRFFWVGLARVWAGWRQPVLRQNSVRRQVIDLSALIRRRSRLNGHSPAPPASTPPVMMRQPP